MIKNLLYSLFLHSLFLLIIYSSFSSAEFDETKSNEVAVSLISISGSQDSSIIKPLEKKVETPKKPEEIKEKPKPQKKPKEIKPKKETSKPKPKEPTKTIPKEEKSPLPEIAEIKEPEIKPEEVIKEEVTDESKDEEASSNDEEEPSEEIFSDLAGLDLSAREKFNIQSQLKICYSRAVDESELESNIKITLKVQISTDGYISSNLDTILEENRYNNPKEPNYKIAIDNARRAIDLCSPLRNLPLDKYDIWKEVLLEFGGQN